MTMMAAGAAYLTRNFQRLFITGCMRSSSSVCDFVNTKPANIETSNAPSGIPILLVNVSAKSKIDPPKIFTSESTPNDNALGIPTMKISIPNTHAARFLRSCFSRIPVDTTISSIAIDEVSVAKSIKMKKMIINILPNGIWPKIAGKMTKISPGPSAGEWPSANTAGNITRPAKIEMVIFKIDNVHCRLA